MSSAAVRQAMVEASVGNVRTCASLDQKAGIIWTTAPVVDVLNVLDELERLQGVEKRLKDLLAVKRECSELEGVLYGE